jgi:4-hydroxybenzoate polyprenyltransferase
MLTRIRHLLEMIRFSHTLFALPFALLAAMMAWRVGRGARPPAAFQWRDLAGLLICMAGARSAAMAFNRLADRRWDALNPRTAHRHLPAGLLSVGSVTAFTVAASLLFVAGTLCFLPRNPIPLYTAVPVLAFLFGYSFTKRFTAFSHFWLGAAMGLAPLAAWVVVRAQIAWPPLLLAGAVALWGAGFDMIYACQDVQFDRQAGLYSLPARWGVVPALRCAALCHLGMVLLLAALPLVYPWFGRLYLAGIAAIAGLLVYEHRLVRPDDLTRVNRAFFHVNVVVSVGLFALAAVDLFWS